MQYEYIDIRELRAIYLTSSVTFAFCDIPDAFQGNQAKEVDDFISGEGWVSNVMMSCMGIEPNIEIFYQVDEKIKTLIGFEIIILTSFQYLINDPYDQEELETIYKIAEGWAEETGAKIIFVLDTSIK